MMESHCIVFRKGTWPFLSTEEIQRVMQEATLVEDLARLYRENGHSAKEALTKAIDVYEREKEKREP